MHFTSADSTEMTTHDSKHYYYNQLEKLFFREIKYKSPRRITNTRVEYQFNNIIAMLTS